MAKVTIIGAGQTGATTALWLAERERQALERSAAHVRETIEALDL
jgi:glycine/D-amino acid oxidase-like deaminating enzyme